MAPEGVSFGCFDCVLNDTAPSEIYPPTLHDALPICHALLGGRQAQGESQGRTICSCFGVGEVAIRRAIEQGCDSPASLGAALKCGTNCGSCIPELKNLLATLRVAQ